MTSCSGDNICALLNGEDIGSICSQGQTFTPMNLSVDLSNWKIRANMALVCES